jgi:hypothetical protein
VDKRNAPDEQEPQTIDGATGRVDHPPRRIDLSNLRDVRLELAALYRRVDAGQIDSRDGSRRAFILKTIHDVIVSAELEKRLTELEERVPAGMGNRLLESRTH